jgi:phage baseplate assembly protein gpV
VSHFPLLQEGRVISVDVPNRRLTVDIPSAQILGVRVRMSYAGPADGVRVKHDAMPGRGTWGLVAFPYNDARNGIWLGSFYPALNTAHTSNTDQFLEYNSHWSGAYEMLDGQGQWTKSFPDGTFIQVASATTKPATFRQTVDPTQTQQLTAFPDSERVANPPAQKFNLTIAHGSGTTIKIDPNGNVTLVASNASVTVTTPTVKINGQLQVTGNITAGFGTSDQVDMQLHRHSGAGGTGTSGPPIAGT